MTAPEGRRHCGRCQIDFEADPTLFFQTDWALCPACQEILLPRRVEGGPSVGLDELGP